MGRNAFAAFIIAAGLGTALAAQQQPAGGGPGSSRASEGEALCRITGVARGAGVSLPGVAITVLDGATVRTVNATQSDGTYRLSLPAGTYQLRAELTGFDRIEREVVVAAPPACDQKVDLALSLTPRRPAMQVASSSASAAGAATAGRAGATAPRFQRLDIQQESAPATAVEQDTVPQDALLLPPGFSSDASGDAIAVNGAAARVDNGLLNDRNNALARGDFQLPPGLEGLVAFGGFGQPGGA